MQNHERKYEQGYILVTSLIILSLLAILGVVGTYKAVVETKVSGLSADRAKAGEAAKAGLERLFWYWNQSGGTAGEAGFEELNAMRGDITGGSNGTAGNPPTSVDQTGAPLPLTPPLVRDLYGESLAAIEGRAGGDLDAYIAAGNNIRVYQYQYNGSVVTGLSVVANSNWGQGNVPQVAVWVTSYDAVTGNAYPYGDANVVTAGCSTCNIVTYALGRSGQARRLVREVQSVVSRKLTGVDAITNAPGFASWQDACDNTNPTSPGSTLSWSDAPVPDVMIEATQSPYMPGSRPSGTAMSSNTNMGRGGKKFRKDVSSTSELTMDSTPIIAYSLHNTASGVRVKGANTTPIDTTAADDPSGLPTDLMRTGLSAGTDKIKHFMSGNEFRNKPLFNLDAYRWAAEQFTCQNAGNPADTSNGAYCGKAEQLRSVMGSPVPVTGRLTLREFAQNVRDARPMFGIVRVMWPTGVFKPNVDTCVSAGGRQVSLYDLTSVNEIASGKDLFPFPDGPVNIGSNSRVIVYGMLLIDYFTDNDGDGYFDATSERLIEPIESTDAYLKVSVPMLVNPAMPLNGGTTGNFFTIAPSTAPAGSTNNLATTNRVNGNASVSGRQNVNLASPYDGWFPLSEGLTPAVSTSDGSMALMDLAHGNPHGNGLIGAAYQMMQLGSNGLGQLAGDLLVNNRSRLSYYYELMYATADRSDPFSWPITSSFPGRSTSFCIGAQDCDVSSNHDGDKFHLLFPNGYTHGVKAALAALNMTADEWNNLLSGNGGRSISDLAAQHASLSDYGNGTYPKGSPFGTDGVVTDSGINAAATIQASQNDYFRITRDTTTGYGILDSDFADLPAIAYSGGLIDTHSYSNVGGILYTPGPLEWEPGNKGGLGYVAGSVITGMGVYNKSGGDKAHQVFVFDPQAVDNIATMTTSLAMLRYAWQELK